MISIGKFVLIIVWIFFPTDLVFGKYWYAFTFENEVSLPSNFIQSELQSECSLVFVEEIQRNVIEEMPIFARPFRKDGQVVPTYVKLEYRIKEVLVGDSSIAGEIAYGTAWEYSGKSFLSTPTYSEWVPEPGDKGIWLVKKTDGKLLLHSADMLGVRFPIYESGAHLRSMWSANCEYSKILECARRIKSVQDRSKQSLDNLFDLVFHENKYVSLWATWELCQQSKENDILKELRSICSQTHPYPVVQTIADEALLSLDIQWQHSELRKEMMARWLSLDYHKRRILFGRYMRFYHDRTITRGYDLRALRDQLKEEMPSHKPTSLEWRSLDYMLRNVDLILSEKKDTPGHVRGPLSATE